MQKVDSNSFVKRAKTYLNFAEMAFGIIIILGVLKAPIFLSLADFLLYFLVEQLNVVGIIVIAWSLVMAMGFLGLIIVLVPFAILPVGLIKRWTLDEMRYKADLVNEKFSFPTIRIAASFVLELTVATIIGIVVFTALCSQGYCHYFSLSNLFVFFGYSIDLGFFNQLPQPLLLSTLGFYAILRGFKVGNKIVDAKLRAGLR